MFSLIITIISIALVAALAVSTIYYGGSAFSKGQAKAAAAALVSQAQQVAGAEVLYQNDNPGSLDTSAGLTALTTGGYLANVPTPPTAAGSGLSGWTVAAAGNGFTVSVTGNISSDVCAAVAKTASTQVACTSGASGSFAYTD